MRKSNEANERINLQFYMKANSFTKKLLDDMLLGIEVFKHDGL